MRIYPDPEKWAARVKNVPIPLRNKALAELDELYFRKGFKSRGNGKDSNGHYIDVDIRPGSSLQTVYEFLNEFNAAAVTVEPGDVPRILGGKNPITLAVQRNLAAHGARENGLELLQPDQLADQLQSAQLHSLGRGDLDRETEQFITDDLVSNGLLDEAEVRAVDGWLETQPEKVGLAYGNRSNRFDDDMGDFAPDPEVESWENPEGWRGR